MIPVLVSDVLSGGSADFKSTHIFAGSAWYPQNVSAGKFLTRHRISMDEHLTSEIGWNM